MCKVILYLSSNLNDDEKNYLVASYYYYYLLKPINFLISFVKP